MRKVHVISTEHTGDALLDEALKHIHDTQPPESLHSWIHYLSGEYNSQSIVRPVANLFLFFIMDH